MTNSLIQACNDISTEIITDVLHDAELITVSVNRLSATVHLDFCLEDGTFRAIKLQGLKAFRCEDLVLQNVINSVLQSIKGQIPFTNYERWINWVTSLADSSAWLNEQRKQEWLNDLSGGKINLIVFEPSAGATLAVICEQLFFYKGRNPQ